MNLFGRGGRIFAYGAPVDMRKGFAGLEALILQELGECQRSPDMIHLEIA